MKSETHIKNPSQAGLDFLKNEMLNKRRRQQELVNNFFMINNDGEIPIHEAAEFIDWAMSEYKWTITEEKAGTFSIKSIIWFWHTKEYSTYDLLKIFLQLKEEKYILSQQDKEDIKSKINHRMRL